MTWKNSGSLRDRRDGHDPTSLTTRASAKKLRAIRCRSLCESRRGRRLIRDARHVKSKMASPAVLLVFRATTAAVATPRGHASVGSGVASRSCARSTTGVPRPLVRVGGRSIAGWWIQRVTPDVGRAALSDVWLATTGHRDLRRLRFSASAANQTPQDTSQTTSGYSWIGSRTLLAAASAAVTKVN